ncbi:MAG: alcohol dehydrogenase catalytic domain-containing protein [Bacteroidales bacterium]|jgi:threonine dehydrogenase-like Zn-dependent dehydrogenase|nr:alcohol dehydrogenase catalytic domain-containing protein [Bacteroidales bacterium]
MKAAVLTEYGKIIPAEVNMPATGENDVLVRIRYASICGSDQHIFRGEFHPRTKLPLIPGHEFAGIVDAVGSNVTKVSPGEKVTVDPIIWCGTCPACQKGHFPACTSLKLKGIDMDGGFAEFISVPEGMIFKVPESIPDEHAALIEVLSIGFHASARAGLKSNDDVFIMGSGKVGQSIMHAASTITTGRIIMADILGERLNIASSSIPGIITVNALRDDPVAVVRELTGGKGVDVAFEAVGHEVNVEGRLNPVRTCINVIKGAGTVCVLGLSDHPAPLLMKELIWKEARIIASRVSHGEFSKAIDALAAKKLDPSAMITGILDLADAQKGFEMLEKEPAKHLKILLKVS